MEVPPVTQLLELHDDQHKYSPSSEETLGAKQTLQKCTEILGKGYREVLLKKVNINSWIVTSCGLSKAHLPHQHCYIKGTLLHVLALNVGIGLAVWNSAI